MQVTMVCGDTPLGEVVNTGGCVPHRQAATPAAAAAGCLVLLLLGPWRTGLVGCSDNTAGPSTACTKLTHSCHSLK